MKGLIIKDIYCTRTLMIIGLLIMLLPGSMLFLMGGGMNVDFVDTAYEEMAVVPFAILYYCVVATMSSISLNAMSSDENSGWGRLQPVMPLSSKQIVAARFGFVFVITGSMIVGCLLISLLAIALFGVPIELMLTVPVCLGLMELVILMPTVALCYRYGSRVSTLAYTVLLTAVTAVAVTILLVAMKAEGCGLILRLAFYVGLPLVTAAVGYASHSYASKHVMDNVQS